MVEKLCENYGNQLLTHEDVAYYSFPALESLAADKVESRLRTLGFGYRAKFIQQSAAKIVENGGRDWLMNLRKVSYPEAKTALMTLPGIGAKVYQTFHLFFKLKIYYFYFILFKKKGG
jgi:N-glycosylase/DNA lyase